MIGAAVLAVTAIIASVISVAFYIRGAEQNRADVAVLTQEKANLLHTIGKNEGALQTCLTANAQNALSAVAAKEAARAATIRAAEMERAATTTLERIADEAEKLQGHDDVARTAIEPLPDWLADGLRGD